MSYKELCGTKIATFSGQGSKVLRSSGHTASSLKSKSVLGTEPFFLQYCYIANLWVFLNGSITVGTVTLRN